MKKFILAILMLVITQCLFAQSIETKLTQWSDANPIEKLYLHLDRESYLAGQRIWLKGYFISGLLPSGHSSTMYVELLNNESAVILKGAFPAYMGGSFGQLDLPEQLTTGTYLIRAYSPIMLNQPGFIFYKRITIYGKDKPKKLPSASQDKSMIQFFPEGGNFIAGALNTVAFKVTNADGMPQNAEGDIIDEKGNIVTSFKTFHDGMGTFIVAPQMGSTYTAFVKGSGQKYPLPNAMAEGVLFSVKSSSIDKKFKIAHIGDNNTFKPAYIIGQTGNHILFKQVLNGDKKEINGIIPTNDLFSGILQLTIFNKDNMPLAERLTFIDNREYILPAQLKTDTLNTGARKRNHFSLFLRDTVIGHFSISITDADYENTVTRPQNIYSWMLLNSDIKGYVHNSAYYFSKASDSVRSALDLVMMTNGWSRFKWTAVAQNTLPQPKYKDPGFIDLSGRITIEGSKKPLANRDVIMLMSPVDTSKSRGSIPRFLHTDSLGRFSLDSMIFYDKMRILFSETRGKKSKYISVNFNSDSLNRKFVVAPVSIPYDSSQFSNQTIMSDAFSDFAKAEGLTLENVTVKVRQKSEMEKLDEEYSSGLFSSINSRTLDLRNEDYGGGDIFQYLQGRIAGLSISGTPGNYNISYRGGGFGGNNVSLFLDEMSTDVSMIESIPINQIAMVKLVPNSVATAGGGTALAIYMKKGTELNAAIESPTDIITYNGYSVIKEFYNPDYDKNPEEDKTDERLTLSWSPNVFLARVNPKVPIVFYNNDRTKRFKIVAEGVDSNGRMLMFEQVIDPSVNQ